MELQGGPDPAMKSGSYWIGDPKFGQLILVQTEQVSVFGVQIVDWNCCSAG
jgi:hypothetical protein